MPAYHQMGHHSENLLRENALGQFKGAILSPVNYAKHEVVAQVEEFSGRPGFEVVLDPQLYVPDSDRGHLPEWDYFPSDVDTADLSSDTWWSGVVQGIAEASVQLKANAVCTPAVLPKVFADDYYGQLVKVGGLLRDVLGETKVDVLQTAVVSLPELSLGDRPSAIASILSTTEADRVFLVLNSDTHPRREFSNADELAGAIRLVRELESAGLRVTVGFVSSDVVLWKAAGATSVATGKFFNLRRFTKARFEEPTEGGGQLPYWFEEGLLAFMREGDLRRYRESYALSNASLRNPYGAEILEQLAKAPGTAWLALSWRQFMYWFADIEARISRGGQDVKKLLKDAEQQWVGLDSDDYLMEERHNTGEWIRAWRIAIKRGCSDSA